MPTFDPTTVEPILRVVWPLFLGLASGAFFGYRIGPAADQFPWPLHELTIPLIAGLLIGFTRPPLNVGVAAVAVFGVTALIGTYCADHSTDSHPDPTA